MWLALVVNLHNDGPDWTAIAGIVVAGVIGPALGYWAGSAAEKSKQRHEEKMADIADLRDIAARATVLMGRVVGAVAEIRELYLRREDLQTRVSEVGTRIGVDDADVAKQVAAAREQLDAAGEEINDVGAQMERTSERLDEMLEEAQVIGAALAIRLRGDDPIAIALAAVTQLSSEIVGARFYGDDEKTWNAAAQDLGQRLVAFAAAAQEKLGSRLD